jgi:hypothetical protein
MIMAPSAAMAEQIYLRCDANNLGRSRPSLWGVALVDIDTISGKVEVNLVNYDKDISYTDGDARVAPPGKGVDYVQATDDYIKFGTNFPDAKVPVVDHGLTAYQNMIDRNTAIMRMGSYGRFDCVRRRDGRAFSGLGG